MTGKQVMDAAKVPGVLAVMATAGLYDDSGKWLYHTGLPAKSGVGGGLIAVSPGKFGIAVFSPPLDDAGNSVRAQRAIADISNALGGNPYAAASGRQTRRTACRVPGGLVRLGRLAACRPGGRVPGRHRPAPPRRTSSSCANGDRITGEVRLERGRLSLKTDDIGTIYMEWDKVATRRRRAWSRW